MITRHHAAIWLVAATLLAPTPGRAQGSIQAARNFYASASYEEALWLLDGMERAELQDADRAEIARYRALCLFALGRVRDAEATIEAMVTNQPLRRMAEDDDVPPRMRAAISAARQRIVPGVVQAMYAEAKAAFDAKEFESAALKFREVLDALADPELAGLLGRPPLVDVKTLAQGFMQLSIAATPPPPAPPAPAAPAPPQPDLKVYTAEDLDVVQPQIIRQELPVYPGVLRAPRMGVIEVLVNESGAVEGATMRIPIDPIYDRRALAATKQWSYRPATRNGEPVRFLKRIRISLAAN